MSVSFDVMTQPWIPVVDLQGEQKELGILDVLTHAHELRRIQDASPLVEYSVYRFLIVFLMDALRPETEEDLEAYLSEGRFDPEVLNTYIAQCRAEGVSFDLFDEKRPFMQSVYREEWDREPVSVSSLDVTIPHGDNPPHFDHMKSTYVFTPGKALRCLLATLVFCQKGGRGYSSGMNPAPPWFALIDGETLFQTLVYGMIEIDSIPLQFDKPSVLWRNQEDVMKGGTTTELSWMYGMLFPARRIHLIPQQNGDVSEIYFEPGMTCLTRNAWCDPHVTYFHTREGRKSWKPTDDSPIWCNITSLIDIEHKTPPQIIAQYYRYFNRGEKYISVVLYGVQTDQAKCFQAYKHDLVIPRRLLGDSSCVGWIEQYISTAERLKQSLYEALRGRDKEKDKKKELQGELPYSCRIQAVARYYAACEKLLWHSLDEMELEGDLDELKRNAVNQMIQYARESMKWAMNQVNLRGLNMIKLLDKQESVLESSIRAIRKEMS